MAGDLAPALQLSPLGLDRTAYLHCHRAAGAEPAARRRVCRARHVAGQDNPRTVGLDRREFLAALDDPLYEEQMSVIAQDAARAGVFGAPTFVYDTKRFLGNDRLEWLVKELTALSGE